MSALFASGHAVDLVLVVLALELALIGIGRRRRGVPVHRLNLVIAALPGLFLLLALRAALTGSGWPWVALCLAASFPAHLADLSRRRP